MDNYLDTMAQLAGVMVGFANLANAISKPNVHKKDFHVNKVRILLSTEMGLVTMLGCIAPHIPFSLGISEQEAIKIISILMSLFMFAYCILSLKRLQKLIGTSFPVPYISKILSSFGFVNSIVVGLNGLGLFGEDKVIFVFYFVMFNALLTQAFLFTRLIGSILSNQDVDQSSN
ncbi:MAG TPA: hypothetical protein VGQ59_03020 [Cyclobacteriaceae bacterium]|jgi:hypothetical protein|nr:hypothetical protein [Cyclobacteriaceae bacterium]